MNVRRWLVSGTLVCTIACASDDQTTEGQAGVGGGRSGSGGTAGSTAGLGGKGVGGLAGGGASGKAVGGGGQGGTQPAMAGNGGSANAGSSGAGAAGGGKSGLGGAPAGGFSAAGISGSPAGGMAGSSLAGAGGSTTAGAGGLTTAGTGGAAKAGAGGSGAGAGGFLGAGAGGVGAAGDLFVAPWGKDENPGTFELPLISISLATAKLKPGGTVWLRGGTYRQAIEVQQSGLSGQPISLRGYPGEAAVVRGSVQLSVLGEVKAVDPADPCRPTAPGLDLTKLYQVTLPASVAETVPDGLVWLTSGSVEPDLMKWAQTPPTAEPYFENTEVDVPITSGEGSSTQFGALMLAASNDYWVGHCGANKYDVEIPYYSRKRLNNNVAYLLVTGSQGESVAVSFKKASNIGLFAKGFTADSAGNPPKPDLFAVRNHPSALTRPGEYVYYKHPTGELTIVFWPTVPIEQIEIILQPVGVSLAAKQGNFTVVQDLFLQSFGARRDVSGGVATTFARPHEGLTMRGLDIRTIIGGGIIISNGKGDVVDHVLVSNVAHKRGISLTGSKMDVLSSTTRHTERTGIYLGGAIGARIVGNTVTDLGVHGNGISAYGAQSADDPCQDDPTAPTCGCKSPEADISKYSQNVLIAHNALDLNRIPITMLRAKDVMLLDNQAITSENKTIASWGCIQGQVVSAHNLAVSLSKKLTFYFSAESNPGTSVLMQNNVVTGGWPSQASRANNVYFNLLLLTGSEKAPWVLSSGEVLLPADRFPSSLTIDGVPALLASLQAETKDKGKPLDQGVLDAFGVAEAYAAAGLPFPAAPSTSIGPFSP